MGEKDLEFLKTEFPDKWKNLTKKLVFCYENFNSPLILTTYKKKTSSEN